jgi:hypothetical protein
MDNTRVAKLDIARNELSDAVAVITVLLTVETPLSAPVRMSAARILKRAHVQADLELTGALSRATVEGDA